MKGWMLDAFLRTGFASLLFFAAASKLADLPAFATVVARYRLLSPAWVHPFAWFLPVLEGVVAVALLFGRGAWRGGAWLLLVGMMTVFAMAVVLAWARGLDVACGCFGGDAPVGLMDVVLRTLLLGLALFGLDRHQRSVRNGAGR